MIQKITLEIQNDTGLEFEDTIELRPLRHGDYWFNGHDKIVGPIEGDYGARRHVLTPKVDHELEEAKKLIGKWVTNKFSPNRIFKITDAYRGWEECAGEVQLMSGCDVLSFSSCQPFPLPTWRCCAEDRPRYEGRYFTRVKGTHEEKEVDAYCFGLGWNCNQVKINNYEWLDEGER